MSMAGGRVVQGHVLGYDQETGFGLVQALARLDNVPICRSAVSARARAGDRVVVAAAGGRQKAIVAQIRAKQEFAGYWEYVLDEALFTAARASDLERYGGDQRRRRADRDRLPAAAATAGRRGQRQAKPVDVNMAVPIDLLKPIL